jgi:DNA-binding response OmpR family regulator
VQRPTNGPLKILVVDDDAQITEVVGIILEVRWPGTVVYEALDAKKGLELLEKEHPDLVILDIMLPDMDGIALCKEMRRRSSVPIIFVTARTKDIDAARGLEAGADDYVAKPFSHLELLARIRAVLRRAQVQGGPLPEPEPFASKDLRVDFATREAWVRGELTRLTPTEFAILRGLVKNWGRVVPKRALIQEVWGPEPPEASKHLRVHVQHLRQKLHDDPNHPQMIATEWRVGYRFLQPPLPAAKQGQANQPASAG